MGSAPRGIKMLERRRFPPPWTVEKLDACFVVRDHNGQALSYVYYKSEPRRRAAAKLLSKDEARPLRKVHLLLHRTTCISLTIKPCCLIS
jgi:hypothetical protein